MKPILLSVTLGAFLYSAGFQAAAQYTPTTYQPSPKPGYGYESPVVLSPAYGQKSPSPAYGYESPSPAYGYESPSPAYGNESPSPAYGYQSPSPAYGNESPSPVYNSPTPSPKPGYPTDGGYGGNSNNGGYGGQPTGDQPSGDQPGQPPKDGDYPSVPPVSGCGTQPNGNNNGASGPQNPGQGGSGPYGNGQGGNPDGNGQGGNPDGNGQGSNPDGNGNGNGNNGDGNGDGNGDNGNGNGNGDNGNGNGDNGDGNGNGDNGDGNGNGDNGNGTCPSISKEPRISPVGWQKFVTNPATAFDYKAHQCQNQCVRKSVADWTAEEWCLYTQLFNEANRRGWMSDIEQIHQLGPQPIDGQDAKFHNAVAFFPWHRFYISHFEQLMQRIDHEVNPGKAAQRGEFCLGYWDWKNSDDVANAYKFIFNSKNLGDPTIDPTNDEERAFNIPNGPFKDLQMEFNGNPQLQFIQRGFQTDEDSHWRASEQAQCNGYSNFGDERQGASFHACWEDIHGRVHTKIGGTQLQFTSAADPLFYLHHSQMDAIWYRWQQGEGKSYPTKFSAPLPVPYQKWVMNEAKDIGNFCATYAGIPKATKINAAPRQQIMAPPSFAMAPPSFAQAPPSFAQAPPAAFSSEESEDVKDKAAAEKILSEGRPVLLARAQYEKVNRFAFMMASTEDEKAALYATYKLSVEGAIKNYELVLKEYGSQAQVQAAPAPTFAPTPRSFNTDVVTSISSNVNTATSSADVLKVLRNVDL